MGVPKFTAWLRQQQKNFNKFFIVKQPRNIDNLFIDANSTIYDVFSNIDKKVLNEVKSVGQLEELIISGVTRFYDDIINLIDPKMVYIAIDGVVPFSKITQQRIRRYTSYYVNESDDSITNDIVKSWHPNSNISPGTPFMQKLNIELTKYINTKNKENKRQYIYSSFEHNGEGEHKIIQYIKECTNEYTANMIYGNDTDIIFLSVISYICNSSKIFLFKTFEKQNQFYNVKYITDLLINIITDFVIKNDIKYRVNKNNVLDLIILCFIIGNDFLQHVPFIDAFKLPYVILSYVTSLNKFKGDNIIKINSTYGINYFNLFQTIQTLSEKETFLFKSAYDENKLMINNKKPKKKVIENIRINQDDYGYFDSIVISDNDIVNNSSLINYKYNYYNYYLKTNNNLILNQLFKNYFEGFNWTIDYYFNVKIDKDKILDGNCLDWDWYFKYPCVPFVSDLMNYLSSNWEELDKMERRELKTNPLSTNQQLFYIIPKEYLKDINIELFNQLSKYPFISPIKAKIDTIHKSKLWECHAIVPLIDSSIIRSIIKF